MKVLYITTVSGTINAFLIPHIQMLMDNGYKVDVACSIDKEIDKTLIDRGVNVYDIPFSRQPLSRSNIKAFRKIVEIQKMNNYGIVHVHTPVASFVTRLALRNENTKMVYTAHGFHFYKGAPILNWLIYYPLEKLAARWTDILITINNEDFQRAKKFKFRNNKGKFKDENCENIISHKIENVKIVHGVGINYKNYLIKNFDIARYRKKLGLEKNDFVILVLAEINKNKNHIQLIKALGLLKEDYDNIKVICAGDGPLKEKLERRVEKLNLQHNFRFIGFRSDVKELINISDCVGLFSKREGLGKCLLEAMIMQKPFVATDTRGPRDLVHNRNVGTLVRVGDYKETAKVIERYVKEKESLSEVAGTFFINKNDYNEIKNYEINKVCEELNDIYKNIF